MRSINAPAPSIHDWSNFEAELPFHLAKLQVRLFLCFWPTSYESEVLTTPSSGSINLLEQPTEPRETVYLLGYQFIVKAVTQNSQMEEMQTARYRERGMERSPKLALLVSLWMLHYKGNTNQITDHWWLIQPPDPLPSQEVRPQLKLPTL